MATQKRIVLLLFPNSGRVLCGGGQKEGTCQKMDWLDLNVNESLCGGFAASYVTLSFREQSSR